MNVDKERVMLRTAGAAFRLFEQGYTVKKTAKNLGISRRIAELHWAHYQKARS